MHTIHSSRHTRYWGGNHTGPKLGQPLCRNRMIRLGMGVSSRSGRRLRRSGVVLSGPTPRRLALGPHFLPSSRYGTRSDTRPPRPRLRSLNGRRTRSPCTSLTSPRRRPCRTTTTRPRGTRSSRLCKRGVRQPKFHHVLSHHHASKHLVLSHERLVLSHQCANVR